MVSINMGSREIACKIVYYGPGRCGKTTNLQIVHQKTGQKAPMTSIDTETDRTLFFDFLPLELGTVAGMKTKFSLYTVPGQSFYAATRKLVLNDADGVVFVADSNPDMMKENIESMDSLIQFLGEFPNMSLKDFPVVLQWNKRDVPNPLPVTELNEKLNRTGTWPSVEAVAVNGVGVMQSLKLVSQRVLAKLGGTSKS